jgi:hypothetical protein
MENDYKDEYITTVPGNDREIPVAIYEEKSIDEKDGETFCQKNPEYRCGFAKALNSCGNCRGK